jgi:hypothetical protein
MYVLSIVCAKCSASIYFPALSRFLTRPQLLTRLAPLAVARDISPRLCNTLIIVFEITM